MLLDTQAGILGILNPDPQYTAFEQSQRDKEWSSRCLLASFAYLGIPSSLFDVGCGDGHLVELSSNLGVDHSYGVDLYTNHPLCERMDLNCITLVYKAEMVVCWELAEHLLASRADKLCNMLAKSTLKWLLFSAAIPGQGGSGHLNEQPRSYWRDKLYNRGLVVDGKMATRLSQVFIDIAPVAWWYGQNLMVFKKG